MLGFQQRCRLILCAILGLAFVSLRAISAAELSEDQIRVVQTINTAVINAGKHYASGDFAESGQQITLAMEQMRVAMKDGSAEVYDQLVPAIKRIEKAHALLEFEGISLPPFRRPIRPVANQPESGPTARTDPPSVKKPTKPKPEPEPPTPPSASAVSFTSAVAPILVNRCGRCHIADSKGGFNTASYAALMKGPPEGVVVFPGDTIASRLIETIETGDMPRGGGRVTPQELHTLKAWIVAGAKFDGTDPEATIGPANTPAPVNMNVEIRRATGSETVSFAGDVAPLLVSQCNGCHIDAMQTRGGLRMDTFAQLMRGGDSGAIVVPGKGSESLLVQKLRGMVGAQMPAGGRPPLSDESIQLISTWIDEGATLDGASETQPIRVMSQLAWAASATSEQLSERRAEIATANLKLVTASSEEVPSHASDHFQVTGPVSPGTLELVASLAEEQMKIVRTVIKGSAGEDFYRGKATIFVFPKRYDYSEFAKMVESRSVPSGWESHWSFDGIDAYVAMVCSESEEDEDLLASRLTAPLVSLAVATRGRDVPRWFADGAGQATAYRLASTRDRDARRKQEAEIASAVAKLENAKQFLEAKLSPEQTDLIGAAIVATMLDRTLRRNFDSLVRNLGEGMSFDESFQVAFRGTPQEFVDAWMGR